MESLFRLKRLGSVSTRFSTFSVSETFRGCGTPPPRRFCASKATTAAFVFAALFVFWATRVSSRLLAVDELGASEHRKPVNQEARGFGSHLICADHMPNKYEHSSDCTSEFILQTSENKPLVNQDSMGDFKEAKGLAGYVVDENNESSISMTFQLSVVKLWDTRNLQVTTAQTCLPLESTTEMVRASCSLS